MSNYNPVYHSIWTSNKFEQLNAKEKLVYLYLITNERIQKTGLYHIQEKHIACDCDLPKSDVKSIIIKLIDKVLIKYQYSTNTIYILNFFRLSIGMVKNPYILYKSISRQIELLQTDLWEDFIKDNGSILQIKSIDTLSIKYQSYNSNNKNKDNNKNKSKDKKGDFDFISDIDWKELFSEYVDYRKKIKKTLNPVSYQSAYNKLLKLSKSDLVTAREIVGNTIASGWQGLFELKSDMGKSQVGKKGTDLIQKNIKSSEKDYEIAKKRGWV